MLKTAVLNISVEAEIFIKKKNIEGGGGGFDE